MRKFKNKGKCVKVKSSKSKETCKLFDEISIQYLKVLEQNEDIIEIQSNVRLIAVEGDEFCSDFVCLKSNNELMVRECVYRKHLSKPLTITRLDISMNYWNSRGVIDFGIVIEKGEENEE